MRKLIGFIGPNGYTSVEDTPFEPNSSSSKAPAVHQDTMQPLRHPVTGHIYDSKSAYMACNKRHGLEVVGNDLFSNRRRERPDKITEAVIMDRMERAEAIYSDPAKLNARRNENLERLERSRKLLDGNR